MRETDKQPGETETAELGREAGGVVGGRPKWAETQTKLRRGSQSGRDSEPGTQVWGGQRSS